MESKPTNLLDEYKEATSALRFANALLLGELTVYLGSSASLVNTAIGHATLQWSVVLSTIGIILSVAFLAITERAGDFTHAARNRAKQLEKDLGFNVHSQSPSGCGLFTATNGIRLIIGSGLLGWFGFLIWLALNGSPKA